MIFANIHEEALDSITALRTMGSVPFCSRYRLIDFPLSNMVESQITKIGVVTNANFNSLMDHVGTGKPWDLSRKNGGIYMLPPYSINSVTMWGNRIDAIYGNIGFLHQSNQEYVLMSDCYNVINLDYEKLFDAHENSGADITIVTVKGKAPAHINSVLVCKDIADDGRIHSNFNQTETRTGRISSTEPNLQNIPVRTELGREMRKFFCAREGWALVDADYSQIELRVLAHVANDTQMQEDFRLGRDIHTMTAARVFDMPEDLVTPQMRSRAKAVNFGIVYGQQAYGLSQSLHIPFYEAKEMIDRYFEVHPGVRTYLDDVVAQAHKDGYAVTLFGRRRYIPELKAKNAAQRGFGERTAMNHPMQGTAADIIKLAMRQVQDELVARDLGTRLMLQVHDELDLSVPESEVEEVSDLLTSVMESVVELSVPLLVDVSAGANWAEAH